MAWRLLLEVIQVDVNIHREIQIICRLEKLERNDPKPKNNCYRSMGKLFSTVSNCFEISNKFHGPEQK